MYDYSCRSQAGFVPSKPPSSTCRPSPSPRSRRARPRRALPDSDGPIVTRSSSAPPPSMPCSPTTMTPASSGPTSRASTSNPSTRPSARSNAARAAPPPTKILLALWLYATVEGVGSARELDRLARDHLAYQWIAGDVEMNYHSLADFRTQHVGLLDDLLTGSVATLIAEGRWSS